MPTRSNKFVASYQIEAICQALRLLVTHRLEIGTALPAMLRCHRDAFLEGGDGTTLKLIPEIDAASTPSDLLAVAEVLRVTMIAFLTPEEAEEQRGYFGFRKIDSADN